MNRLEWRSIFALRDGNGTNSRNLPCSPFVDQRQKLNYNVVHRLRRLSRSGERMGTSSTTSTRWRFWPYLTTRIKESSKGVLSRRVVPRCNRLWLRSISQPATDSTQVAKQTVLWRSTLPPRSFDQDGTLLCCLAKDYHASQSNGSRTQFNHLEIILDDTTKETTALVQIIALAIHNVYTDIKQPVFQP